MVVFEKDGFMVAIVPLTELKDEVDRMDSVVPFKSVELGRYV